jgi:hypothetical protein
MLSYGPEQFENVKRVLTELLEQGLLVSDTSILSTTGNKSRSNQTGRHEILDLGIITSGRPSCLVRCLRSYVLNAMHYGRKVLFYVMDDTLDYNVQAQNQNVAKQITTELGAKIVYFGATERLRLASELVTQGLPPDVVNFALANPKMAAVSPGANRNALLLASVGGLIASVDDDTVCDLVESPRRRPSSLALSSAYNPWVLSFYADRAKLLESVAFTQADFLGAHLSALGQTTAQFLSQFLSFSNDSVTTITHDLMETMEKGVGQILVSQTGIAGDAGFGSPSGYLTAGGSTRARLLQSESAYNIACTSREIKGLVNTVTLTDSDFTMTGAIGLDNRSGLVPFFPFHRGEDAVFGALVRKCFSKSLSCHLPMAVFHAPPVQRSFNRDAIWQDANRLELSSVILLCINSLQFSQPSGDHESHLRVMGTHLMELGNLEDREFWNILQQRWFASVSQTLVTMEDQRHRDSRAPKFWLRDVEKYVDSLRQRLACEEGLLPQDISNFGSALEVRELVKKQVKQYGTLLKNWPDIVAAASSIRNKL